MHAFLRFAVRERCELKRYCIYELKFLLFYTKNLFSIIKTISDTLFSAHLGIIALSLIWYGYNASSSLTSAHIFLPISDTTTTQRVILRHLREKYRLSTLTSLGIISLSRTRYYYFSSLDYLRSARDRVFAQQWCWQWINRL